MRIRSFKYGYTLLLSLLLLLTGFPAQAQQLLTYGTGATGTLSETAPVVLYTFQGEASEVISLQVLTLSGTMQPVVSLNDSTGSQIASSSSDTSYPLANAARLNATLPQTGLYTVIVTSAGANPGEYAIRLDGIAITQQPETVPGTASQTEIPPGRSAIRYTVPADPENLLLATLSVTGTNTLVSVSVTTPGGQSQGLLSGGSDAPLVVALAPADGLYTLDVLINAADLSVITLDVSQAGTTPDDADTPLPTATPLATDASDDDVPAPVTTEEATPPQATVTPVPDATATFTATMIPQVTPTPTSTVSITGTQPPTATFTPSMTLTATSVSTATATATTQQATATFTPSYTPTTPPAAQTAPEDARFNNPLQIPLDNTVSVLDFVSYPDGDREDRVRYEVTGMNNNSSVSGGRARLVISVSCFGENTDQIQLFTGGQTYTCGQTLVDREVTADSDTGSIVITAVGGSGTYVQWVLTGTATRVN